ncbi:hypothetical protein EHQ27_17350 [Leptospira wolffii]|uniref:LIC12048 family lipoprotein n=1 Tax=Leptospira wolffii TaxID=409998 RepID=UPI0010842DF1|nr:LIC12048 family lipoprotein [Leptospira wolffii]TGK61789.1 hypothetical protein EHQ32_02745 [Leptospira wolffii]TGK66065.1 hypothetical protein EHQ27_17350 [Leptospira wolffii]TGK74826.1 hypothetical protein EHQ35_11035 [Leptospira wolffii]TGL30892.1 hypothetical protein EHQ57_05650 [Leptospira wolffii]
MASIDLQLISRLEEFLTGDARESSGFTNSEQDRKGNYMNAKSYSKFLKYSAVFITASSILNCLGDWSWGKRGDVDLSRATWLVAEKVPLITERGGLVTPTPGIPTIPVNNLFKLPPGTKVNVSALGGSIDPTGTTIVNDFDGDGILNENETTTNPWIGDYPVIESVIAPPITLKVALLQSGTTIEDSIESEISSDDFESGKSEGTEKIHQSELNLRTVQFQDQFSATIAGSGSVKAGVKFGVEAGVGPVEAGMNFGANYGASWSASNSLAMTTTKWADQPFKNNLDSNALNLKTNASSQKARKYRSEKSTKSSNSFEIKANAGYVRAALYIKNNTVNMPVKLRNILCSLMFESPTGELIPVKSFNLLNADGSTFEIEVYGDTEFGPYVIELNDLNTNEVQRAIASGYNPKIYIVDYQMTHVKDSNYRSSLLNFSGDNLKVIEENTKGRTGLVKIVGPNIRQMFRITAFDVENPNNSDICKTTSAAKLVAGTTLEKALGKIACSGMEIEFENYVIDFSEIAPTLGESKLYIRGIKSLAGIKTTIPCDIQTKLDSDGNQKTACVQKPLSQWSEAERSTTGVWAVYSKGKYYSPSSYKKQLNNTALPNKFDAGATTPAFMVDGVESMIWAGDTYDIVYVSLKDLIKKQEQFGTNPLETGLNFRLNTAWDLSDLGAHPYYPDTRSVFLGEAGFGEKVQLQVKLDNTNYLNPSFGTPQYLELVNYYTNFTYNNAANNRRYEKEKILDFEMSLGFGGKRTDWMPIGKDLGAAGDNYKIKDCGQTLDYTTQTFYICLELPKSYSGVDADVSLIKLFMRPSLNSAYRRTIWPLAYQDVRKVQSRLYTPASAGTNSILVTNDDLITDGGSLFQQDDVLRIYGDPNSYIISGVNEQQCEPNSTTNLTLCKKITLASNLQATSPRTSSVYVLAGLTQPNIKLSAEDGFFTDWNSQNPLSTAQSSGLWESKLNIPLLTGENTVSCSIALYDPSCLGLTTNFITLNWLGAYNQGVAHWNSWTDGGNFINFLSGGAPGLTTNAGRSFQIEANRPDVLLQSNAYLANVVSYTNGRAVVISTVNSALAVRIYDIKSGLLTGPEISIPISSQGFTSNIRLKVFGDKAVVIHRGFYPVDLSIFNYDAVNVIDLNTGSIINSQSFGLGSGSLFSYAPKIEAISDTQVIRLDTSTSVSGSNTIYSANLTLLDIATGLQIGSTLLLTSFTYPTTDIRSVDYFVGDLFGNKVPLIVYASGSNATKTAFSYTIQPVIYNITNASVTGIAAISSNATGAISGSSLKFATSKQNGNQGIVIWYDNISGAAYARGINLDTPALQGSSNISLETSGVSEVNVMTSYPYGLLSYVKSFKILAKGTKLADGSLVNSTAAILDTSTSATGKDTIISSVGVPDSAGNSKFITIWNHIQNGQVKIRGRIGNINVTSVTANGFRELLVSPMDLRSHTGASMVYYNWVDGTVPKAEAMVIWNSTDGNSSEVRANFLNLGNNPSKIPYGLNNFFVSPLIERDYTIKAKISY